MGPRRKDAKVLRGARLFRPSDLPTFRPSDLQTFRPSDLPTFRPSDLQTLTFPTPPLLTELKDLIARYGAEHPWLIFVAIVILPGLGFPSSLLLLLAGAVWGADVRSALIAIGAVILNIVWTHLVAAGPGKNLIARLLGERWERWRMLPRNDHFKLACMLRLTPGVPLCVQNYALGLLGVPLWQSVAVAIPITGLYIFGFVLTGGAIFEGRAGLALTGISLVAVAALGLRFIAKRKAKVQESESLKVEGRRSGK